MKLSLSAVTLIAALASAMSTVPALAYDTTSMQMGMNMLQTEVAQAFAEYKIDADPSTLSLAQIAVIMGVLNDPDRNSGGASAKSAIEAAIRGSFNQ